MPVEKPGEKVGVGDPGEEAGVLRRRRLAGLARRDMPGRPAVHPTEMLDKVATFYDNEVNATVDSLTSILEPLIILFMGACIGAIVISLYLPMFDYVKLLQRPGE